jgi:riboflavin kinase/FMN adenylyltransferase
LSKKAIMVIHYGYENLKLVNPVVTLGIFDGVHKGHRALLDILVLRAKELKGESVVITFSPHPRLVLEQNTTTLSFLTTIEEKTILLREVNIDHLVIIEFNKVFSNIPACDFVNDILVGKIGMKHLIIGYNHHFGRKSEGDFNTIKQCAESLDFIVEQVPGFNAEEGTVSSSIIREALLTGKLDEANRWLGYSYSLSGKIVKGRQIGRSIGFPTANIELDNSFKLIPSKGVYAVEVHIDDRHLVGMMSIGTNPTVNNDTSVRNIEVHILDFNEDIYDKTITVVFRKRLRNEIKFENTAHLSGQMKLDKEQTSQLLT